MIAELLGTDADGTAALGNGDAASTRRRRHAIGGASADAGNLIAGNQGPGIALVPGDGGAEGSNEVLGNKIGTAKDGSRLFPIRAPACASRT